MNFISEASKELKAEILALAVDDQWDKVQELIIKNQLYGTFYIPEDQKFTNRQIMKAGNRYSFTPSGGITQLPAFSNDPHL